MKLTYFQAELCKVLLRQVKVSCGIKDIRLIDNLIKTLNNVPERPTPPDNIAVESSEDEKALFRGAVKDYESKIQELNTTEIEFKISNEDKVCIKQRISAYKGYNPENDFIRSQIIDLADRFKI